MLEHIYFSKQTWDSNQIRNFDSLSIQNSFHVLLSNSLRWRISWTFFKRHEKNSFSCFGIKKIFQKARWFNETKARTNVQIKYYEKWNKFIVSWLWKACAFDSCTTKSIVVTLWIRHLVLKYIVVSLLTPYC